jgi:hypothetical protein
MVVALGYLLGRLRGIGRVEQIGPVAARSTGQGGYTPQDGAHQLGPTDLLLRAGSTGRRAIHKPPVETAAWSSCAASRLIPMR